MSRIDQITDSAEVFGWQLAEVSRLIDADVGKVIEQTVIRIFNSIINNSPVDTGSFRASHGITNLEPSDSEGLRFLESRNSIQEDCKTEWTWKVGNGNITIFNNQPYAERLEYGSSKQAPLGIYTVAVADFNRLFNALVSESRVLDLL